MPTLPPTSEIAEFPIVVAAVNLGTALAVPLPPIPPVASHVTVPSALTTRTAFPATQLPVTRNCTCAELTSTAPTDPSTILLLSTELGANFPMVTAPSTIFGVVTMLSAIASALFAVATALVMSLPGWVWSLRATSQCRSQQSSHPALQSQKSHPQSDQDQPSHR